MAGFEIVVRPAIFPNIRPAPSRALPPVDDPDKGWCEINFLSDHPVSLSTSFSASTSESRPTENHRRVDEARVYQQEDDGTVNRENFVDVEVANKIVMDADEAPKQGFNGDDLVPSQGKGFTGDDVRKPHFYEKVEEKPNIEIRKRNKIKRPSGAEE